MGQRQKGSLSTQTCQNSPSGPLCTLRESKPTFIHVSLVIIHPSTLLGFHVHTIRALSGDQQIDISHLYSVSHGANSDSRVARLVPNTISHGRFTHRNWNGSKKGNANIFPLAANVTQHRCWCIIRLGQRASPKLMARWSWCRSHKSTHLPCSHLSSVAIVTSL